MSDLGRTLGWQASALAGSPHFLRYVDAGTVTWGKLWTFLCERRVDAVPVLALMRFFHARLSRGCSAEGDLCGQDARLHPELREWAQFVANCDGLVPEDQLRDSLAQLLAQGIIKPVYREILLGLYREARGEQQDGRGAADHHALAAG